MTQSDPTPARDQAGSVRTRSELDWRDLEAAAFAGHPRIQNVLRRVAVTTGPRSMRGQRRTALDRARTSGALLLTLLVLVAFYVVTGEGRGSRGSFVAADDALAWAGGLVAAATLVLLVLVVSALRRTRADEVGASPGGLVLVTVLTSLAMLVLIPVGAIRGAGDDVPLWGLWLLPMVGHLVVAVLFLGALSSPARVRRLPPTAAELAEELPVEERDRISADLRCAIADLARRGVITRREAEGADDAELGHLALTMAARAAKASRPRGKRGARGLRQEPGT